MAWFSSQYCFYGISSVVLKKKKKREEKEKVGKERGRGRVVVGSRGPETW